MRDRRVTYGLPVGFRTRRGRVGVSRWWRNFV